MSMLIAKKGNKELKLLYGMANRHGLIAGSTGSGKTVTLQVMAENFSRAGVPVFMPDIKGDLTGLGETGGNNIKVTERFTSMGINDVFYSGNPVAMWDVYGQKGSVLKTSVHKVGPMLLSRLLNLSPAQEGTLLQLYKICNIYDILMHNLNDVVSLIQTVEANSDKLEPKVGRISKMSLGTIQRSLLQLEYDGEDVLFDHVSFSTDKLFCKAPDGRGVINILSAEKLINSSKLYSTLMLWLMTELYQNLPEVGDMDKPSLVLFFDEAHLMFTDAPAVLKEKISKMVRLMRSKGVGIYFVSQNPGDIPDDVLAQLGNRVQHSMRAFTPKEQKAINTIAQTFRINPTLDIETAIKELKTGEALVSFLQEDGSPAITEKAMIIPPVSRIGAAVNGSVIVPGESLEAVFN